MPSGVSDPNRLQHRAVRRRGRRRPACTPSTARSACKRSTARPARSCGPPMSPPPTPPASTSSRCSPASSCSSSSVPVSISGIYTGGDRGVVTALDRATGEVRWEFDTVEGDLWGDPESTPGRGLVPTSRRPRAGSGVRRRRQPGPVPRNARAPERHQPPGRQPLHGLVVALDLATGALEWFHQVTPHDIFDRDQVHAQLVELVDGTDVVVSSGKSGVVVGRGSRRRHAALDHRGRRPRERRPHRAGRPDLRRAWHLRRRAHPTGVGGRRGVPAGGQRTGGAGPRRGGLLRRRRERRRGRGRRGRRRRPATCSGPRPCPASRWARRRSSTTWSSPTLLDGTLIALDRAVGRDRPLVGARRWHQRLDGGGRRHAARPVGTSPPARIVALGL